MAKQTKNEAVPQPSEPTTGRLRDPPQPSDAAAGPPGPALVTVRAHPPDKARPEGRDLALDDEEKDKREEQAQQPPEHADPEAGALQLAALDAAGAPVLLAQADGGDSDGSGSDGQSTGNGGGDGWDGSDFAGYLTIGTGLLVLGGIAAAADEIHSNEENQPPTAADDANSTDENTILVIADGAAGDLLANDSDPEGDSLTITQVNGDAANVGAQITLASGALLTVNADGSYSYDPNGQFDAITANASDSFTYTIDDGAGGDDTATVNITVTPVNDPPVAADDSAAGNEDSAITTPNVLANDSDVDNPLTPASITGFTQGANGSVVNNGDGSFSYTPNTNFNGADSFSYTIDDGAGGDDTATVNITVTPVNDPPVAGDDSAAGNEDSAITTPNVLANDSDVDNPLTPASITGFTQGANGSVVNNGDGSFSYTPNPNFNGTDSFSYTVTDDNGATDTATVNITVNPVNDAPVAVDDSVTTNEDTDLVITASTLTGNDTDTEGDAITVTAVSNPTNGTVSLVSGSITFTPAANFNGAASFDYSINDGNGGTDTATVNITVNAVNDPPLAADDSAAGNEDTAIATPNVLANDSDIDSTLTPASITGFTQGSNGSVANNADGTFTYTPDPNFNGADSFTYTVDDGAGGSGTATVNITVNAVNDAPVAVNDSGSATEAGTATGSNASGNVLTNDSDVDNTSAQLVVSAIRAGPETGTGTAGTVGGALAGNFGSLTVNADGSYSYVIDNSNATVDALNAGESLTDTFTYTVSDGAVTDIAELAITIDGSNDAPTITSDGGGASATASTPENTTAVTTVTASDPDTTGTLSFSLSGGADQSLFAIDATTGTLSFAAAPDFEAPTDNGADNVYDVQVQVSDGASTDTQAIAVTVTDLNDNAPVITSNGGGANASINAAENSTAVTTVIATDADAGSTLTYSISGGADAGKFTINSTTGTLSFIAAADFETPTDVGADNVYDVTVQASDGTLTDAQAIAVTVTDLNDNAPVITSNGGGANASINAAENSTAVTTVIATDADAGSTLTYSISGGADAGKFTINSTTGTLSFIAAADFETPTDVGADNVYDVTVQASDGTLTDTQAIAVSVTDLNDNAPIITSNGGGANASINVAENTTAVTTVIATDADAGTTLAYSISGGADAGKFTIDSSTGTLSFITAPDFETPTDAGANNVYDVQVSASDGTNTDSQAIAVSVTDVAENNNVPQINDQTLSLAENSVDSSAVTDLNDATTGTDADGDGQAISYAITAGNASGAFAIDAATGAISVADDSQLDRETTPSFALTVQATAGPDSDSATITINLSDVNDNTPVITSPAAINVAENSTAVTTVTATDPDTTGTLSFSISGGADQALFAINATTGVLSFGTAPDFEAPTDVGPNNVYDVQVQVSDSLNSDSQAIAVTVTDVAENNNAPVITSDGGGANASINVAENSTAVTTVIATDADAGSALTYSISGGADQGLFAIDATTGELSFITAPDFETPTDAGTDNVYDVTVQASDGTLTDTQAIAVSVTDAQEALVIELANLGTGGFTLKGIDANDYSGRAVSSAGDVNGDGFDDLLIGAFGADPNADSRAGESYVVFGGAALGATPVDLGNLGAGGFTLNGIDANDFSGRAVSSAGDVNGDGFDDLLIGAYGADPNADSSAGESYVVFGGAALGATSVDLGNLGTGGFTLNGVDANDFSGYAVSSAGDVNGDGFDDLLIGAHRADPNADSDGGESYVVFGGAALGATTVDLGNLGAGGFTLNGIDALDRSGRAVSSAGDVNGDGFDDLLIGAYLADPNGDGAAGENYVVFGGAALGNTTVNLGNLGSNGFTLNGIDANDFSGYAVSSVGDVNGDGFDDLLIGAYRADPNADSYAGESYVVFGGAALGATTVDLGNLGAGGFTLNGIDANDFSGRAVSSAGDVNGDGFDDLLIGADGADPNGDGYAGESYVVFGGAALGATSVDLGNLGSGGVTLNGIDAFDRSGRAVSSAGDVNGDGFDDLLIGADRADPNADSSAGESYVIFGGDFLGQIGAALLGDNNANTLTGTAADESLIGGGGNDTLDGAGGNDVLVGGEGDDVLVYDAADTLRVDGGNGRDSLRIDGSGVTLDLIALNGFATNNPQSPYTNIEIVDLSGSGNNSLTLNAADLFHLTDAATGSDAGRDANLLRVDGNSGDAVDTLGLWTNLGAADADGNLAAGGGYTLYQDGQARLLVQDGIDQSGIELAMPELELSALNGNNGFQISGEMGFDYSGRSVSSAGDVNGDGFDDLIVGANYADPNGSYSGASYVVFGQAAGFAANVDVSTLNGPNGFQISGAAADDRFGYSVSSAGDVNGDGFDDLIVGAYFADPNGTDSGASYVVFGQAAGFAATLELSTLNGSNGFQISGEAVDDRSGRSVSAAGDVNGDGFDDLIVGAPAADPNGSFSGASYVVFGQAAGFAANLDLSTLVGSNGFQISGEAIDDRFGRSVSAAGDVNGDGFDDLIVGAYRADPNGSYSGASYVVFGQAGGFAANLDVSTLVGSNGFQISGEAVDDYSGRSVSAAGDVNGDGFDDLIVGAYGADPNGIYSGASYVVFGQAAGFAANLNLSTLNGSNGFQISGAAAQDYSGRSVSAAGDVNGDGFDDLIVGAPSADPNGIDSGASYVVFGQAGGFAATLDVSALNGSNGFQISGEGTADRSGRSVSAAGDVNGDGFDDLIVGAVGADPNGTGTGASYVIFGGNFTGAVLNAGTAGDDSITGTAGAESLAGGTGNDTLDGLGGNDVLIGGEGDDTLVYDATDTLRVDGGTGRDTLDIPGTGVNLNLTALNDFAGNSPQSPYTNIEIVDLSGSGNNSLMLNAADLLHITDAATDGGGARDANLLRVDGNTGDAVSTGDAFTNLGAANADGTLVAGGGYTLYQSGQARLLVDNAVDQSGIVQPITPITLDLGSLGAGGFTLNGIDPLDYSGFAVSSAGDVNGDGFDDLLIGAHGATAYGVSRTGESYVVFGGTALGATPVDLGSLGSGGFTLNGIDVLDRSGRAVSSAGDVNGDGFDDLLIGAYSADPNNDNFAGESYVVFGDAALTGTIDLGNLGPGGFTLNGIDAYDRSGYAVSSAGDVNGDGFDDLLIGAYGALPNGDSYAGESYVVFGAATLGNTTVDLGNLGTSGFTLNGSDADDYSGRAVSSAGDVNGDGFDDLLIGADRADPNGNVDAGESYVVFGAAALGNTTVDLGNLGLGGFTLNGIVAGDYSGRAVSSAGDVNGDGFDDLLIGAYDADSSAGESYVVFGAAALGNTTVGLGNLGASGFTLNGIDAGDYSGRAVSSAGDVNGDGFDDLLIGAFRADPNNDNSAGESYVVFGGAALGGATVDLGNLGTRGFNLNGINEFDYSGIAVSSAGDVNGDGFDDLLIGADGAESNADLSAGESYVVFGGDFFNGIASANLGTAGDDALAGTAADESLIGGNGNDTLDGAAGNDVLIGGAGDDVLIFDALDQLRVDGGLGFDSLQLTGGADLDLGAISNSLFTGIEQIDAETDTGANDLILNTLDALALSDESNDIFVQGDAADTLTLAGSTFTVAADQTVAGETYNVFVDSGTDAQIFVDQNVAVTV